MQIQMAGFHVELSRKRIKNINLRINSQGEVKVSAPMRLPLESIHHFLQEKSDWIRVNLNRLKTTPVFPSRQFVTGEIHLFLGKPYSFVLHENASQNNVFIEGECIHCFVTPGADSTKRQVLLQNWYRDQLNLLLPPLMDKWQLIIGVQVHSIGVKAMKTRWGSCHPVKKHIWISVHLMQKSLGCLEYVVVHELVHLLEASHNARFYALVNQFMPNWQGYHKQLKSRDCI